MKEFLTAFKNILEDDSKEKSVRAVMCLLFSFGALLDVWGGGIAGMSFFKILFSIFVTIIYLALGNGFLYLTCPLIRRLLAKALGYLIVNCETNSAANNFQNSKKNNEQMSLDEIIEMSRNVKPNTCRFL